MRVGLHHLCGHHITYEVALVSHTSCLVTVTLTVMQWVFLYYNHVLTDTFRLDPKCPGDRRAAAATSGWKS